jgi:hypothetical protein
MLALGNNKRRSRIDVPLTAGYSYFFFFFLLYEKRRGRFDVLTSSVLELCFFCFLGSLQEDEKDSCSL